MANLRETLARKNLEARPFSRARPPMENAQMEAARS
jgi:hypothetical protein